MIKILKAIFVIQEIERHDPFKKSYKVRRINPYNPLSYIAIILILIIGILMFGFMGIWKEVDVRNPFKWS